MSEWIECSKREPAEPGYYMIWGPKMAYGWQAEWDMGEWWDDREERIDGVTHWQCRPEPPKVKP